jgi:hypothetical protein
MKSSTAESKPQAAGQLLEPQLENGGQPIRSTLENLQATQSLTDGHQTKSHTCEQRQRPKFKQLSFDFT